MSERQRDQAPTEVSPAEDEAQSDAWTLEDDELLLLEELDELDLDTAPDDERIGDVV